jgi:hypothetical protein
MIVRQSNKLIASQPITLRHYCMISKAASLPKIASRPSQCSQRTTLRRFLMLSVR